MNIELTALPNLILAALVAAPAEDAARWAGQIRFAAETAEIGVVARELKGRLPTLKSINTEWTETNGDNGESYVDWLGATVTFTDDRTLSLSDNGLCEMREYLRNSSDDEGNAPWLALAAAYEQANPDADGGDAEEHALAQAFGIPVEDVPETCSRIWEFVFFCETDAKHGVIDLDARIAAANPSPPPTDPGT